MALSHAPISAVTTATVFSLARIQSAKEHGFFNMLNRNGHRRRPHADALLLAKLPRAVKSIGDDLLHALVHLIFIPEVLRNILNPFEVRNDHTTAVSQDVGNNK